MVSELGRAGVLLGRHLSTIPHLKPRQVYWRLRYRLRGWRAPELPKEAPDFAAACREGLHELMARWAVVAPPDPGELARLRDGAFTFVGESVHAPAAPPWHEDGPSRLWQYELHYCAFFRDFALGHFKEPRDDDRARVLGWVHDWIDRNPPEPGPAWDAYPTAARLLNWALAESVYGFEDPAFRRSYAQQAEHLARNLEFHIDGNHLLQNAAALAVAGTLLGRPDLAAKGRQVLRDAVAEQILPDGGHHERAPMYHAHVLRDLLTVHAAAPDALADGGILRGMGGFLRGLLQPDGDIPLFGDAVLGTYPPPAALCDLAGAEEPAEDLGPSGFFILRRGETHLTVKASPPGPRHQPGHAHCDALSYECAIECRRVIVDSGVHGYDGSPYRAYCRSTRAHNTMQLGGIEQMLCWKTFRVGWRYRMLEAKASGKAFRGAYRIGGLRFERRIELGANAGEALPATPLFSVHDHVTGSLKPGLRTGIARSFVHLHPDFSAVPCRSDACPGLGAYVDMGDVALCFLADDDEASWQVLRASDENVPMSYYCPGFGVARASSVLVLRAAVAAGRRSVELGYHVLALPTDERRELTEDLPWNNLNSTA